MSNDILFGSPFTDPYDALRHHVSGAVERGEAEPIVEQPVGGFTVVIAGEYGNNDGSIHLFEDGHEIVMWDSAEWIEDPSLVFVIANAIVNQGKTNGETSRNNP